MTLKQGDVVFLKSEVEERAMLDLPSPDSWHIHHQVPSDFPGQTRYRIIKHDKLTDSVDRMDVYEMELIKI